MVVLVCWCADVLWLCRCASESLSTCVLWHGSLVGVSLLLKDNVAKLQHGRDDLQHA